ncbi:pyridoxal phosphate-dependent decarboxylase family protein [Shimia sp. MIT1388]|uniref:pyridoxal phosphate-dependent decarboxylase family protein n=1 Tax=Shimia sp. MIT1388 TaxID=3096992 RepID=UPI00399B8049
MTIPSDPLARQAQAFAQAAKLGEDYLHGLSDRQVNADTVQLPALDIALPQKGYIANDVLSLMQDAGGPGTVATAAGRYFGYVIGGALPAASGARALLSAWDQCANADTGPSVMQMEQTAVRWIIDLLNLPAETEGAFTTGATMANMTLLATARDTLLARLGHPRGKGLLGAPALRVIASAEIHATVLKSLRLIGLGSDNIERVPTDAQGRMCTDKLPQLDASCIVLAQAGNVCTGAFDPIGEIADICQAAGAWLHVDGAFGLWARAAPELADALTGLEKADSWVVDAHKTLNAPYDSGLALCRHPEEMRASMAIGAAYLPPTDPSPADLTPEFSRAARGAETYAALLSLGRAGLNDMILGFHNKATRLADALRNEGFTVPHHVHFNQVFVTLPDSPELCAAITAEVQASGEAWFGAAAWQGQNGFRLSVSNWATTEADIDRLVAAIVKARETVLNSKAVA